MVQPSHPNVVWHRALQGFTTLEHSWVMVALGPTELIWGLWSKNRSSWKWLLLYALVCPGINIDTMPSGLTSQGWHETFHRLVKAFGFGSFCLVVWFVWLIGWFCCVVVCFILLCLLQVYVKVIKCSKTWCNILNLVVPTSRTDPKPFGTFPH